MKLASASYVLITVLLAGCPTRSDEPSRASGSAAKQTNTTAATQPAATPATTIDEWIGIYSSPSEIGVFTGTVLTIEKGLTGDLEYRKTFYSDVVLDESEDSFDQKVYSGSCRIEDICIYIPIAFGWYRDGKPHLHASIDRYTKVAVNGQVTLMRDDAYTAFRSENKLYDYGILIKVATEADKFLELEKVEHTSIKILYADETKPWKDPFVHGPNERE